MIAEVIARHEEAVRTTVRVNTSVVLLDARPWEPGEGRSNRMVSAVDVVWELKAGEWHPRFVTVFSARMLRDGTPSSRVDQRALTYAEFAAFFTHFPEAEKKPRARVTVTIEEGTA